MAVPNVRIRRATLDDRETLRSIWESMHFSADDLDKRLTEFQVVEKSDGKVVGAIGFQVGERSGRIHSEGFSDFSAADAGRAAFWQRIQTLSSNHGIFRLWTQENAPFWKQQGFQAATEETLKKLPAAWADPEAGWLTLPLKDENEILSLEKELAVFMQAEKQRTARAFQQGRTLRTIATVIAFVLALAVFGLAIYIMSQRHRLAPPGR